MIITYSQPAYRGGFSITALWPRFCNRLKVAEFAATFAADDFIYVWLVPDTGAQD